MTLININNEWDSWLNEYGAIEILNTEIMEQLSERDKQERSSSAFTQISASVRIRIKQYKTELQQLIQKLDIIYRDKIITSEEYDRKTRQLEMLKSKEKQMEDLFNKYINEVRLQNRSHLLEIPGSTNQNLSQQSVEDIREDHQRMLSEQEKGLEELSKIISRQKNVAQVINSEIDLHNDIIDELAEHVDNTDQRVIDGTQNIRIIDKKYDTCGYWVIIIVLFVSIIIVSII